MRRSHSDARLHLTLAALILTAGHLGCGQDGLVDPGPPLPDLSGSVTDTDGRSYPDVTVRLDAPTGARQAVTRGDGSYRFDVVPSGDHVLDIDLPRATRAVTALPIAVRTTTGTPTQRPIVISPRPVTAHLNLGPIDFLGEIRTSDGGPPAQPSDALYARNVFDAPLGLLTAIETPTGAPVTRAMWEAANGEVTIACHGNASTVALSAQGLIADGTYTVWLNLLNVVRAPGEVVSLGSDVVRIEPLGAASGTRNVLVANASGAVSVSVGHPGCVLTQETALVVAVLYHLTGTTYGAAHIPDPEEATQLLFYIQ